jgi:acyl-CoA thioester hydrolase
MQVVHQTRFRVRYAETDQMGIVYYANYLIWMELGRSEYCRSVGIRYRDMEEQDGILLAVADAHCRYLSPARYDDWIVVSTQIASANRRVVTFQYGIANETGQELATGETKHIFLNKALRPVTLPPKYYGHFGIVERGEGGTR